MQFWASQFKNLTSPNARTADVPRRCGQGDVARFSEMARARCGAIASWLAVCANDCGPRQVHVRSVCQFHQCEHAARRQSRCMEAKLIRQLERMRDEKMDGLVCRLD